MRVDARQRAAQAARSQALRPDPRVDPAGRADARAVRRGHAAAARRRRHRAPPGRHPLPRARAARRLGQRRRPLRARGRRAHRRRHLPRRAERHRHRERADGGGRAPRAAPCCGTPPASRTCRTWPGPGGDGRADRGHRLQHLHHRGRPAARRRLATPSVPTTSRSAASSVSPRSPTARSRSIRCGPRISGARCWGSSGSASGRGSTAHRLIVDADQERRIRPDLGGHVPKLEDGPWPAFPGGRDVHHHRHAPRSAPACCSCSRRCSSRGCSSWTS